MKLGKPLEIQKENSKIITKSSECVVSSIIKPYDTSSMLIVKFNNLYNLVNVKILINEEIWRLGE